MLGPFVQKLFVFSGSPVLFDYMSFWLKLPWSCEDTLPNAPTFFQGSTLGHSPARSLTHSTCGQPRRCHGPPSVLCNVRRAHVGGGHRGHNGAA